MDKKVLVAYASRAGATAEVAEEVSKTLAAEGLMVDVLPVQKVETLEPYSALVLGSAARIGKLVPETMRFARTRIGRNAMQIAVTQHPLRQRRKRNATNPCIRQHIEHPLLHPTIQHRITRLMNQTRRAQFAQHVDRLRTRRFLRDLAVRAKPLCDLPAHRIHGVQCG